MPTKVLQGDVEKVIGLDGSVLASYTYDAWGQVHSASGSMAATNPIRYRGYYYDTETSLYYLQSRYYDPQTGRFLNADSYESTGQGVLGCNKFAYCLNNPVNRTDDGGNLSNNVKILIGAAVIAAAAACVIATGGLAAAPLAASAANCMATSMLSRAIYGSTIGTAVGAAIGASSYAIQNGTFEGSGQAAIDGASTGFMAGAITGAAAGAMGSGACFVEGTPVLAENGLIPIEKVTAGMMVWSADPETGDVALRQVVQTFVRETGELTHVTIADENGNTEIITCTPEHPFYVEGRGWIRAGALHRGMKVRFASGAAGIVKDVLCEELQKPVAVYNFEVSDFHTYYAGKHKMLVHNTCGNDALMRGVGGKGWIGDKIWRGNVTTVGKGGTITSLNGGIPTKDQAIQLIEQSGGTVLRIEEAHSFPNPHNFYHINYLTETGIKGTIRIISEG